VIKFRNRLTTWDVIAKVWHPLFSNIEYILLLLCHEWWASVENILKAYTHFSHYCTQVERNNEHKTSPQKIYSTGTRYYIWEDKVTLKHVPYKEIQKTAVKPQVKSSIGWYPHYHIRQCFNILDWRLKAVNKLRLHFVY